MVNLPFFVLHEILEGLIIYLYTCLPVNEIFENIAGLLPILICGSYLEYFWDWG
jgi:hypothetical protein